MAPGAFSAAAREKAWTALEEDLDLLVIGGGITGVGVARDAAGRGMRVALVEAGDIAEGTSSRSSRLAHGGLRYLETFDFDLVFEALRERRRLLELAPHLVKPLPFVFPVFEGDPTGLLKLTAGMWLYETLAMFRSPHRHRMLGRKGVAEAEPALRKAGLQGGALYYDAQLDDARLTLAVARAAADAGATILTRARVEEIGTRDGTIERVVVGDQLRSRTVVARARVVLNATGPWSDRIRRLADPQVPPRLRMTKGAHIVLLRERVGNRNAIIFRSKVDGRVMFVLPWDVLTYVGTTDTEYTGDPWSAVADMADVRYLLASANAIFPDASLTEADVLSTWAGVRPLLAPAAGLQLSESATSREHAIWRDPSGLLNIAGGKLTTFRSMAAEVATTVGHILRDEFGVRTGDYFTEYLPLPGAPGDGWDEERLRLRNRAADLRIDGWTFDDLIARHGTETDAILSAIERDNSLGEFLIPNRPYLRAEVARAAQEELALTLEDVLRRRLQLFYREPDGGLSAASRTAAFMAAEPGIDWSADEVDRQVRAYAEAVAATRPKRKSDV